MKNHALALSLFIFISPSIFPQVQAVIRELAGTVEIMRPGSDTWVAASRGQVLDEDTVISTGFRSTAVIALGSSLVTLRPLSRLTVTELSRIQETERVDLNLQTGRVRAEVTAPEGGRTEFNVRSTQATNSVRGTVFEFDTLGLVVLEGTVDFTGVFGPTHLIDAGSFSQVNEYGGRASLPTWGGVAVEPRPDLPIASEVIGLATRPLVHATDSIPSTPTPSNPPTSPTPRPPYTGSPSPSPPPSGSNPVDFNPFVVF